MNFNKKNIPIYLFVGGSLALFFIILVASLVLVLKSNLALSPAEKIADRYDFKSYDPGDPYTSKQPNLDDLLAGPIISGQDPSLGPDDAPVSIVVYGDYTCSFCREQEEIIAGAIEAYPDKVRLVWKDYPDGTADSIAFKAAVAGRCAAAQGKFWEYQRLVFDNQDGLDETKLQIAAAELKIEKSAFLDCLDMDAPKQMVLDNIEEADALDISGVPFVYVNKQEFLGGVILEDLKSAIENELGKADN